MRDLLGHSQYKACDCIAFFNDKVAVIEIKSNLNRADFYEQIKKCVEYILQVFGNVEIRCFVVYGSSSTPVISRIISIMKRKSLKVAFIEAGKKIPL